MGQRNYLTKCVLILLFFQVSSQIFAQSSIPESDDKFLQLAGNAGLGSRDRVNVVFFEVPDTITSTLYFAVYDPGANSSTGTAPDSGTTGDTDHYLIGGTATLSGSNSRKWSYSEAEITSGAPRTGIELGRLAYLDGADYDGWVYFPGVLPSQGEHIGNKYYFKVVTVIEAIGHKNAYRLDVSSAPGTSPTGISGIRSFAYSWSICLREIDTRIWHAYPFVPENTVGKFVIFANLDFDADGLPDPAGAAFDKDNASSEAVSLGPITMSGNGQTSNTGYQIAANQDNGLWLARYTEGLADNLLNTSEFWVWLSDTDKDQTAASTDLPPALDYPTDDQVLRIYSSHFPVLSADHATLDYADDGVAPVNGTERILLQIVDVNGDPALYSRDIWVNISAAGTPLITGASNAQSPLGLADVLVRTDTAGFAWIDVTNDTQAVATITLTATTGLDTPSANETITVSFQNNPYPSMSSAGNLELTEGSTNVALYAITVTERGATSITNAADSLVVRIPAALQATFVNDPLAVTIGGTVGGTLVAINPTTVVITPAGNLADGQTITISGLKLDTAADADSQGRLELSFDGGANFYVTDDKWITIRDTNITYTWVGGTTDWSTDTNWSPAGVPDLATENAVIPAAPANQPVLTAAVTVNNLTIANGASLTLAGYDLTVQGNLSNDGTLRLRGDEVTLNLVLDPDSGTVAYYGATGGAIRDFGATDYYNLTISGGGTWSMGAVLNVVNAIRLTGGTLDHNNIALSGASLTVDGGVYDGSDGGTVTLTGALTLTSGSFMLGNKALTCAAFSQTNGSFTGNTGSITASGNVSLSGGTHTAGTYTLTMTGSGTVLTTAGGLSLYNFRVDTAGTVALGSAVQVGGNLTIASGTFSVGTGNYQLTVAGDWSKAGTFAAGSGLVLFNGTSLLLTDETFYNLTVQAGSSLDVNGQVLSVTNVMNIQDNGVLYRTGTAGENAPADTDSGTVVYRGAAGGTIQVYATTDYYNLTVAGTGSFSLAGDAAIASSLTISGGTLNAGARTITIDRDFNHAGGTFTAGTSTIVFTNNSLTSRILGDNSFYRLTCTTAGKTLAFEAGRTQTFLTGGAFTITGGAGAGNEISLLSTATNPAGTYPDPGTAHPEHWLLTINAGATAGVQQVYVELSFATSPLLPGANTTFHPIYDWCYNWFTSLPVANSGVEDSDGDGIIDRIRVQVALGAALNDDFTGLTVLIQAPYRVAAATPYATGTAADDTFYINISKDGFALDTCSTPHWSISANTSLQTTGGLYVSTSPAGTDYSQIPADEAAPLVGYTLAAAGKSDVLVHFSEPLFDGVADLTTANFKLGIVNPTTCTNPGTNEYLLTFASAVSVTDILSGSLLTFTAVTGIQDAAGNALGVPSHRVSDLALGIPDQEPALPILLYDSIQRDDVQGGIGRVTVFDGSQWLKDDDDIHIIQANLHTLLAAENTDLLYDTNVAASFKNGSLWLPAGSGTRGLVPAPNTGTVTIPGTVPGSPAERREFAMDFAGAKITDGAVTGFFILFTAPNIFCARLAKPEAEDWYRHIAPWSFTLHDPDVQAGNVSIFNNVINPSRGEQVKLYYKLEQTGKVVIHVFTLDGNIVTTLCNSTRSAGEYSTAWNGRNRGNRTVARGIYFIKVVGPGLDAMLKVLVVK